MLNYIRARRSERLGCKSDTEASASWGPDTAHRAEAAVNSMATGVVADQAPHEDGGCCCSTLAPEADLCGGEGQGLSLEVSGSQAQDAYGLAQLVIQTLKRRARGARRLEAECKVRCSVKGDDSVHAIWALVRS